jgi:hypothetical protein
MIFLSFAVFFFIIMLSNLETNPATSMTEPLPGLSAEGADDVALEVELTAMYFYFNLDAVKAK